MSILDDINAERDSALTILQQKINAASELRNGGAVGLDATISELRQQRAAVAAQAYEAELSDPVMAAALAALRAATADMNLIAAKMTSTTTFLSNVASLGGAANKVVTGMQGLILSPGYKPPRG